MFILNIILKTTEIFIYVYNQKLKKPKLSEYSSLFFGINPTCLFNSATIYRSL